MLDALDFVSACGNDSLQKGQSETGVPVHACWSQEYLGKGEVAREMHQLQECLFEVLSMHKSRQRGKTRAPWELLRGPQHPPCII